MSTIATSIQLVNQSTGAAFTVPYSTRTTDKPGFSVGEVTVLTADEVVVTGEYTSPRNIGLRLLSGSDVRVGFDGATYPLRLSGANDSMLLRLDVEGLREVSTAQTVADSGGSLNDKYFTLADRNGEVKVVITTDGVTGLTSSGRVVVVTIVSGDTANAVATAIVAAFAADTELTVATVANLVTFTDRHTGTRTNIAAGDSTFTVATPTTTGTGTASPILHLLSLGTSQVVVAIVPN